MAEAASISWGARRRSTVANGWSLRDLYRTLEAPGANRLRAAYGMKEQEDPLAFLPRLSLQLSALEFTGGHHTAPDLPAGVRDKERVRSVRRKACRTRYGCPPKPR